MFATGLNSRRALVFSGLPMLFLSAASRTAAQDADWIVESADGGVEEVLESGERLPTLRSVVVVRNGNLLAERYYHGASMADLLAVNSVTKSVCSVLLGIAIEQGKIKGVSETVAALLPEAAAEVPGSMAGTVTLEQILTGTTGIDYDMAKDFDALRQASDPVKYTLSLPADGHSQPDWRYNDAAVGLIAPILRRATGLRLEDYALQSLFKPLGFEGADWTADQTGQARSYAGLRLRTRDVAKLAWTMSDGGKWRGAQVIPAHWVEASLRPRVPVTWTADPVEDMRYGYLWFTGRIKDRPVAWAWGYGSQFALMVPSLHLVVATGALNPPQQARENQHDTIMKLVSRIVERVGKLRD